VERDPAMADTQDSLDQSLRTLRIDPERKRRAARRRAPWLKYGVAALLVAASVVPTAFGLGWIYLAAALSGGAWFLLKCRSLLERPGRETARASFRASLLQLCAVLLGAMLDVALR